MYVNLSAKELFYEVRIVEFFSQREKLEAEYREGLEIVREESSQVQKITRLAVAHDLEAGQNRARP
jgi:hypothetical protein